VRPRRISQPRLRILRIEPLPEKLRRGEVIDAAARDELVEERWNVNPASSATSVTTIDRRASSDVICSAGPDGGGVTARCRVGAASVKKTEIERATDAAGPGRMTKLLLSILRAAR
jgi:hypothetical protein